jgi:hypothetical protein
MLRNISHFVTLGILATVSIPLSYDSAAYAQRAMTVPEAMSYASTLEGYEFVLWGLQSLEGFDSPMEVQNWSLTFDSIGTNSFIASGSINSKLFSLNYSGNLSGTFGSTDMTWLGNWTGSLGDELIDATDTATWIFDSGLGLYTGMDFLQEGSLETLGVGGGITPSGFGFWSIIGLEVLGTTLAGVSTGGWGAAAAGVALGLTSYIALDPPPTPPRPPLPPTPPPPPTPPIFQKTNTININNAGGTINGGINIGNVSITINGNANCTIPCTSSGTSSIVSTPEPTSTLSLLALGILGAGATLKRKVKRSHSTEKEPSNVG